MTRKGYQGMKKKNKTPTPHDAAVPQHEDELMTIAQQLEQKGIDKGRQEGVLEGKLTVARAMLANGIDHDSVMNMTGLTAEDLAQIRH
ncbi:Rpn family recombination-promoting nuclease/putative transposase [Serratia proteamaculans]|uniref:Rpn family recombination-promoting nuclease/putative transposase n=1 Tax=Serratia proteamaculans TaxID=28151 RepID=UPI0021BDC313|nr:Rpn family recombination-promoting nuclease/putative transposase [Serratia proteamaculans]